jgi:hypothetical protein
MPVETRTEHFVYYRCPVCQDLFALRKPEGSIGLPPSSASRRDCDRLPKRASDAPSSTVTQAHEPLREVELWRLRKHERELHCIAGYLLSGIELRLMESKASLRSELFEEMPELEQRAHLWRTKLTERGWG